MRGRALLIAWGVAAALVGSLAGCAHLLSERASEAWSRNLVVESNVLSVEMDLAAWAVYRKGVYPPADDWLGALQRDRLLVAGKMYVNPFLGVNGELSRQTNSLGVADTPLAPAGKRPTREGTVLGPGHPPGPGAYDVYTYGAIVCDISPRGDAYVVYGISQRDDQAVVVKTRARRVKRGR